MSASEEYIERLERWQGIHARSEQSYRRLGNARLATGIAAVVLAAFGFGVRWISPWWLVLPVAVFIALAIRHERVARARSTAERALKYWKHALARIRNEWIGAGNQGERFRDPKHLYAEDLDLFGRGSVFELLSTCRTAAGESVLANWLLGPGERDEVLARQQALAELRPRIDLREKLAIVGEQLRSAVDAKSHTLWGANPRVRFFAGARIVAIVVVGAAVVTAALGLAGVLAAWPFLTVVLLEIGYNLTVREGLQQVVGGASRPARELQLLAQLLEILETEKFESPRLRDLKGQLESGGQLASRQIQRLDKLMEYLHSAENPYFKPVAGLLLWVPQFGMAIESWRAENGPRIGQWTAAIGEFEALCSLSCFAYERPDAVFPELSPEASPVFDASGLRHPLIPPASSVANDVALGGAAAHLWVLSGSNMSGKSTLLRAVGLNAVLAWAGAPVACAHLRISRLYIGASMRSHDSLVDHRSRFYAEIERLREIVELPRAGYPTLFLLDELLSGTNSHDRLIGAQALVRGLVERGAIGLITTHDLALAGIADGLGDRAANVHFEDHLEGGEIRFDYRLRPGIVTRSNALALMRAVGLEV